MSRYCSIVTRQKLSRSIKSSLNFEEQEIIKSSLLKKNSSNFWNKILKNVTQFETKNAIRIISNKNHHTNNKVDEFQIISHRILCEEIQKLYNNLQEQISQKQRNLRPRLIRKDIQKFCNNLHKQVSQKQQVLSKFEEAVSAKNDSKTVTVSKENEELLDQFNVLRKSKSASLNLGGYGSLGTFISILQSGKMQQANKKSFGTNYLHTEIKKYCNHIHEKISQTRPRLWTATPLATVTVNSSTPKMENATNIESKPEIVIEPIPEPPVIPEALGGTEEVLNQVSALGEPTFASLGLGGYSPVGIVQHCFEYLHGTLGLEWWLAIALGTLVVRIILFPLVIMAQRNAAKMNNYLPQMQILQLKMTEARQTGNQMDAARYSQELMLFMKEKGVNPLKNMVVPLAQMPIFISFFMGLRQMANVPVDSLRTGGILWFTDLTLPDQYFLMPIITSATLYATIELGTDTAKLSSQNMQLMKYVLRGLPLIILPFTFNFPGAILCYWVSSNFISLAQVGFLRIPAVRDYFKIEPMQKFSVDQMPLKPKGFREGLKDSWENMKITKQLEERKRLDELAFQRAGKGPIVKTYKYDPTKQTEPDKSAPVSVKSR
ncbi:mitochondrial inner membrane protein OXA1L [Diorhabda carinulata]|uniref:mitochondrial inner membrane protein OXA1L n=1 Tax=Diorhabda carinulata TaxID=1163345 RepID=UPI0025A225B2|nr:mitochondrial inner membrane protein OXA1L [Diorhabda carinulata]